MTKNAITLAAALFTIAATTGCNEVEEFECATPEECGVTWQLDPGFSPAHFHDASVEVIAEPVLDHGFLTFPVRHPADCEAPELVISVQGIGRSLPATALASLEVFPGTCDVRTARDVTPADADDVTLEPVLSDLTLDLSEALPAGFCVGHVLIDVPGVRAVDGGPLHFTLASEVCGRGVPPADLNTNSHG
ncbi:MAG: hypothetical protein KC912_20610 [Proteobacteria bacterium]|nr:hypothetical protein [Pseudomonadota bacterium]